MADLYFYAALRRDSRAAYLAGPFADYAGAEAVLRDARAEAERVDPFCHFDGAGVAQVLTDRQPPAGRLNARLGLAVCACCGMVRP